MTVLVLGAGGLLGSTLVPHLVASGHRVLTQARTSGDLTGDLTDPAQARAVLQAAAPDVVVNLVAATNVDACERDPQWAYLTNVRVVENLVAWLAEEGPRAHLVQISTDQLYDGAGPHAESEVHLVNYYAFSKLAAELAAARVGSTILRTNFFGPSRCPGRTSLSDWLVESLRTGAEITVFEDVWFSPLSIGRLAEMIELAVRRSRGGVYNLASREGMSKADFAFALADVLSLPTTSIRRGRSVDAPLAARRPIDMRMDPTRFEKAFGVKMPSLLDEIKTMRSLYAI